MEGSKPKKLSAAKSATVTEMTEDGSLQMPKEHRGVVDNLHHLHEGGGEDTGMSWASISPENL